MNRGEMRSLLREYVLDGDAISWSNVACDRRLNLAAEFVLDDLAEHSIIRYGRASYEFNGSDALDGTRPYPLVPLYFDNDDDFHSVIDLQWGDNGVGGKYVDERTFKKLVKTVEGYVGITERDGEIVYTIVPGPLGAFDESFSFDFDTGSRYAVMFLATPVGAFTLIYRTPLSEIPTGASYDTREYYQIPTRYHRKVVAVAAAMVAGNEGFLTAPFSIALSTDELARMIRDSRARPDPHTTG